jgi:hypothetical protein
MLVIQWVQLIAFTDLSADCKAAGEIRKLQATPITFCNTLGELKLKEKNGDEIKNARVYYHLPSLYSSRPFHSTTLLSALYNPVRRYL